MFKFSAKQKLAIKSWIHATIAVQGAFIGQWFYTNVVVNHNQKWDWASLGYAVAFGVLAPLTRAFARVYSMWAIKYPMLKPVALYLAKRAVKKAPKIAAVVDKALADSSKPAAPSTGTANPAK
jgi:hypothetical protein